MAKDILQAPFVLSMIKATHDAWHKGWDERNGGNISLMLEAQQLEPYLEQLDGSREIRLSDPVPELAGREFIVTGSGKYFRNVELAPAQNLGIIRVSRDGGSYRIIWGLPDGAMPTSELPAHFLSHAARLRAGHHHHRVVMHCHATNLIALTYVLPLEAPRITRLLWEGSTECLVVFPDGVGVLPWMVPGTDDIGEETAQLMQQHSLVLWPFHGVFGTGANLDEAFGLIDTAEKSAEILVKVLSMGGFKQSISREQLLALAQRFNVTPMKEALL
jgi:rhamnulose-1-phosphate aldolase